MHATISRLLELESSRFPILSVYLDTRPTASGMRDGRRLRPGRAYLRSRLRDLARELPPHGEVRESFEADAAAVEAYLPKLEPATQGLAVFACSGLGLFRTFAVEEPFENHVSVGPTADVYPLARYLEHQVACAAVLVDGSGARIYSVRAGCLHEAATVSRAVETPEVPGRRAGGVGRSGLVMGASGPGYGASRLKYQRYLRQQEKSYLSEVAEHLGALVDREGLPYIVLLGTERLTAELREQLPAGLQAKVADQVRLAATTRQSEILRVTLEHLERRVDGERQRRLDELFDEHLAGGLAAAGLASTLEALYDGRVDELYLAANCRPNGRFCPACQRPSVQGAGRCPDCDGELGPTQPLLEEILRQAARTGANLETVTDHPKLATHEGLAAHLRY